MQSINHEEYKALLKQLQIQLVALQRHLISHDRKVLIILEGRDAAGKDGVIKRIAEHLSPRETRIVALGKPSDRERASWYFQRYVACLPSSQELVLMNRSWYNRAGVEKVMGFCTAQETEDFLNTAVTFEKMLSDSGIEILKYYLDISEEEQRMRLESRRTDPLKHWKLSPIDAVALDHWEDYSRARDIMLAATDSDDTPWFIVAADDKRRARLSVIYHLMEQLTFPGKALPPMDTPFSAVKRYAAK